MSEENNQAAGEAAKSGIGRMEWLDLTVDDAAGTRDFYCSVVGWESSDVSMGEYSDFSIQQPGGDTVAGICHARGCNAGLPSQWLVYVRVASVDDSAARCRKLGGKVLDGPRRMGGSNFCVIQDPAGAVMSLVSDVSPRLRKGAEMTSPGAPQGIGDGLDDWVGCMTVDDACAISEAVADLDRMSID